MIRILSILTLACVLFLSACGGDDTPDEQPVRVEEFRLVETSNGDRQVRGTLQNTTSKDIPNAQVQVSLFDADNVQIEEMNVTVQDIPASGEVEFKEFLDTDADVQGARVKSVLVM